MRVEAFEIGLIGTNCYLVWDEESGDAMIFDPDMPGGEVVEKRLTDEGLKLKYIALTHGHEDHMGGVPGLLAVFPGAVVVIGEGDAELVRDTPENDSGRMFGRRTVLEPGLLLRGGDALSLGGLEFKVLDTPGHSAGGVAYYVNQYDEELTGAEYVFSGTVFSGDTLFRLSIGRTDLRGGDYGELERSIREKLYRLPDDTLVLPGHMGPTTVFNEREHNPFVR